MLDPMGPETPDKSDERRTPNSALIFALDASLLAIQLGIAGLDPCCQVPRSVFSVARAVKTFSRWGSMAVAAREVDVNDMMAKVAV
jgi:hypothetical protein